MLFLCDYMLLHFFIHTSPGVKLLHPTGRVPGGRGRVPYSPQLPHVQTSLPQIWRGPRKNSCHCNHISHMTLKLGSSSSNYLEFSVAIVVCFSAQTSMGSPSGFDRTRNVEIGNKNIKLQHLEDRKLACQDLPVSTLEGALVLFITDYLHSHTHARTHTHTHTHAHAHTHTHARTHTHTQGERPDKP